MKRAAALLALALLAGCEASRETQRSRDELNCAFVKTYGLAAAPAADQGRLAEICYP